MMKQNIPNLLTLLNLICGCCAIVCVLNDQFWETYWFLLTAFIADALDGRVARWLVVSSPMGKELDSLADMISFGAAPGAILYALLVHSLGWASPTMFVIWAMPAFILSAFAALRLAKYNLDSRQSDCFIGLATPACTIFVVGLMLMYEQNSYNLRHFIANVYFLYPTIVVLSYLMIAELPLLNFRFINGATWRGNEARFAYLFSLLPSIFIFREAFFSVSILLYISFSVINNNFLSTKL